MLRLLIADTERSLSEILQTGGKLTPLGIELVAPCINGPQVRQSILAEKPDIVLMNPDMPGLSAVPLMKECMTQPFPPRFILFSPEITIERLQSSMRCGVRIYLKSPLQESEVLQALAETAGLCRTDFRRRLQHALMLSDRMTSGLGTDQDALRELRELLENSRTAEEMRLILINTLLNRNEHASHAQAVLHTEFLVQLQNARTREEILILTDQALEKLAAASHSYSKQRDFVDRVIQYVNEHLSDPDLSLKKISQNYLFMNEDYVSKQFLHQTGVRFSSYLGACRIEKAKLLMLDDQASIYNIAEEVGFGNNPQYFTQIFKKFTGMTPTAYKKSLKGTNHHDN